MKKRVTVYWLLPAQPQRDLFRQFIDILAKEFAAPAFEPHLTICRAAETDAPAKKLHQIRVRPITLRVSEMAQSSKFTQTLVVRFRPAKSLNNLVSLLASRSAPIKNPHLSLLYQRLPAPTRRELCRAIKLPFHEVIFDSILAMRCPSPTETTADVRSWRQIGQRGLVPSLGVPSTAHFR